MATKSGSSCIHAQLLQQLQVSLDRIGDACFSLDKNLNCVFANEGAAKFTGISKEQLMLESMSIPTMPCFDEKVLHAYQHSLATGIAGSIEQYHAPTNTWYLHRYYPDTEGLSVFIQLLQGYEQTEQARIAASVSLHNLMNELPLGMLLADISSGLFLYANQAICQLFGYSQQEFLTLTPVQLHPSYETARVVESFQGMTEGKVSSVKKLDALHKLGHVFTVDISAVLVDYQGRKCISGLFKDVTEEKKLQQLEQQAKESIAASEQLMRQAQEIGLMGSWELNHQDYNIRCSDMTLKILGIEDTNNVVSYQQFFSHVHPDDATLVEAKLTDHLEHRAGFSQHFRIVTAGKALKYVQTKCKTTYTPSGIPITTVGIMMDITKQRQAELTLKEEEQHYQMLLEHAPVGMVAIRNDQQIFFGNKKFQQLTGYSSLDITSIQDWWNKAYPDEETKEKARKNWEIATYQKKAQKTNVPHETTVRCKNGALKYFEIGYVFTGKYHLMTFVDITERKKAEAALSVNEAKFRQIAEQMTDMVWIGDLQYKPTYVSPSVEKVYGLTTEEYFTFPLEKRFPQHSIDTFKNVHLQLLEELKHQPAKQSKEVTVEIEAFKKDGTPIWVRSTTKILCNDALEPIGIMGVSSDITARKKAEVALAESEARYRNIYEASPVGMVAIGPNNEILLGNSSFTQLTGYKFEDVATPEDWWKQAYPNATYRQQISTEWQAKIADARSNSSSINAFEARITCKNGEERFFQLGFMPGEALSIITFTDVHELRMAERALTKATANMRNLLESLPQGIGIINTDTFRFEYINPSMCALFGYTSDEFMQLQPEALHPPYELERLKADFKKMIAGEHLPVAQFDIINKAGDILQAEITPLFVEFNGRKSISGVFTDITEKIKATQYLQKAKEQAEENELLLKHAQRIAMMGSWSIDHLQQKLQWSDSVFEILELLPESVQPSFETYMEYVHPDDRSDLLNAYQQHITAQSEYNIRHRVILSNGTLKYIHATAITEFSDENCIPLYTIGIMTDITRQVLSEQAILLAKNEAEAREMLLKEVQRIAKVGFWEYDIEKDSITWSDDVFLIFGFDKKSPPPSYSDYLNLIPPDDRAIADGAYKKHLALQEPFDIIHRVNTVDGKIKHIHQRCQTFFDNNGKAIKSFGVIADITEEQQALEEVRSKNLYIESLLQAIPDLLFVLDTNGTFTSFKSTNKTSLLLPPEKFLGKHYRDVLPTELIEAFEPLLIQTREHKKVDSWQYEIITEGQTRYFDAKFQLLENGSTLVLSRDISAIKTATLQLAESELKYRSVFDASAIGLVAINLQGDVLLSNMLFETLTGYNNIDVPDLDTWWVKAYPEEKYRTEVKQSWDELVEKSLQTKQPIMPFEVQLHCSNGQKRYFEIGIACTNSIILVSLNDIHEKKIAQLQLEASENRFRQIAENINEVFWLRSADDSQLLYINPLYEEIFGRNVETLYQNPLSYLECIHPDDSTSVVAAHKEYLENGVFDVEYRIVRPDGSVRWIRNKSFPVKDKEGNIIGHTGTAEDRTESKLAEFKLKEQEELQKLLMLLATEFINAPVERFDELMNSMLEQVGKATNADRAYVFEFDFANRTASNTYEWCEKNISSEIASLQKQPLELFDDIIAAHQNTGVFHVPHIKHLSKNKQLYEHLRVQNIQSLVALPLLSTSDSIGFIGFDAVTNVRTFKAGEIQLLRVLAEIVTNAIIKKKAEVLIRNSERDYHRLFDTMAQGVVYQDETGHIIKANKSAELILGLTIDQMIGRASTDPRWHAIHEDGTIFPGDEHPAMETLKTGKPVHNKVMGVYHPLLNAYKWIIISTEPEFNIDETVPNRVFATFTDITERKAAENKIYKQTKLLRLLMDVATTYINIPLDQIDPAIHNSLSVIGEHTKADRVHIFTYDFDKMTCMNTYEWCAVGIASQKEYLKEVPIDKFSSWVNKHKSGKAVYVSTQQKLSNEEDKYLIDLMEKQHVKSMLTIPMLDEDTLIGFVGIDYETDHQGVDNAHQQLLYLYAQMLVNVQKRLQTDNALQENKRFLENIIENSGSLIYVKNKEGKYLSVNKKWEEITGYSKQATIGKKDDELFSEDAAQQYRLNDMEVLNNSITLQSEEQLITPTNHHHFISIKFPLKDNDGNITGICGMSTNITDRKKAELLLRTNEERLTELTTQSRTFAWEIDTTGMYTYVSNVVTLVLGFTPEEMIGKMCYYDLHPSATRKEFIASTQLVIQNKESFHALENPAIHKNGQQIWLATTAAPMLNDTGECIGYRGGDTDITNRKTMELALVKSETSYRLLAENSTDVIWILDAKNMRLKYVSPGCMELRGYTVQESLVEPLEQSMTTESYNLTHQKIREAVTAFSTNGILPPSQMIEIEQYHKNGSKVWVEVVAKLQLNTDNDLEVLGVSRNITERKQVELDKYAAREALKESESRLEAIIETTSDNIWSINTKYEILYINRVFAESFKQSFGIELKKGFNILESLPQPYSIAWKEHYDYVLQNEKRKLFEERYDFEMGTIWIEVAMFPIVADGKIAGVSCFGKDITLQKISELALAESEERFRTMFRDNASIMLLVNPENGEIIDANPAAEKFYGWNDAECKKLSFYNISTEPKQAKQNLQAVRTGKNIRYEAVHQLSNGMQCQMEVFSSLITVKGKSIIHKIIHDISAKKLAETNLLEKNKQLNLLIQNIPGVVFNCINNNDNKMNFINDYIHEITGYTAEEINATDTIYYRKLIHPEDLIKFDLAVEEAYQHMQRYSFSYRLLNKDGGYKWVYEIGEFESYTGTSLNKRIDGIIFDITNKISNEEQRLTAAYNAAEAERTRISHEIHDGIQQTLVASKLNIAAIRKTLDEIGGRTLEKYNTGIALLDQGIQEARSIAHSLMPKQVNEYGYIIAVEHLITNLDKRIQVEFKHPNLLLNDSKLGTNLFRITQEAVNNIIKHAKATSIKINLIEAGNRLILSIEDNGIGFDKKFINSPNKGIGMQIMASRAAAMNAKFEVTTTAQKGTCIVVDVPYE